MLISDNRPLTLNGSWQVKDDKDGLKTLLHVACEKGYNLALQLQRDAQF